MLQLLFVDIEKFPVTNAEYWEFCEATGRDKGRTAKGRPRQPVVYVSWFDAMDYACWRATRDGIPWRLPTEAELSAAERLVPEDSDFSAWPLPELPDVDAHPGIVNCLGHECLLGVIYQWTMREEDKAVYDKMWTKYLKRREKREVNAEAKARGLTFDAHTQVNMGGAWYDAGNLISADSQCDLIPKYEGHDTGFRLAADGDDSIRAFRGNGWGSYPDEARASFQHSPPTKSWGAGLGFRLVSDTDEDRVVRGRSWTATSDFAHEPLSGWYSPEDDVSFLGFRLALDTESERRYRGGRWFTGEDRSKFVTATGCEPAYSGVGVGFRLAIDTEADRAFRGSGWNHSSRARVANRLEISPTYINQPLGFRLAIDTETDRAFRGSAWYTSESGAGMSSIHSRDPVLSGEVMGFRLAVDTDADRVYGGGSWYYAADNARAAGRYRNSPGFCYGSLGFRLAIDTDVNRVNRGGGWVNDASFARVANRDNSDPAYACSFFGFRLAVDSDNNINPQE
jgi:formylglycine-generating enzyme required for sulfatase activity